jgi:hypothetical protein
VFRRRVSKRAGGGRGHIEEGRRRLDALGEQSRRREELQQKRRRMRLLRRVRSVRRTVCGLRVPRRVGRAVRDDGGRAVGL